MHLLSGYRNRLWCCRSCDDFRSVCFPKWIEVSWTMIKALPFFAAPSHENKRQKKGKRNTLAWNPSCLTKHSQNERTRSSILLRSLHISSRSTVRWGFCARQTNRNRTVGPVVFRYDNKNVSHGENGSHSVVERLSYQSGVSFNFDAGCCCTCVRV